MNITSRRPARTLAVLAAGFIVASCGIGTPAGTQPVGTRTDLALLGPMNAATGSPVKVGFITDGKSAVVDSSPETEGAQAAVKYINERLGGVKGRPLELQICETALTPAGAADCANQMARDKMPVVLAGTPGVPGPIVTTLETAGIPYFVHTAADQQAVLSPSSYALANVLGFTTAPVEIAQSNGVTKAATIIIDVPAAVGPIKAIAGPIYQKAGIANEFVAVPPGTPDMTPQIQGALLSNPQMFTIVGDPAFCIAGLNGLNTLGFTGPIFINSQCFSDELIASVTGGLERVKVGAAFSIDPADKEVALYETAMATYAPETLPHYKNAAEGFGITLALARAMNAGLQGDLSPDSVKAAFASAPPQPVPMLEGQTFQCNRKLFKLTPSVCSTGMTVLTLDAEGKVESARAVDSSKFFEAGA
jgi:branched-chain amino acid transport system substrate-binding protein